MVYRYRVEANYKFEMMNRNQKELYDLAKEYENQFRACPWWRLKERYSLRKKWYHTFEESLKK